MKKTKISCSNLQVALALTLQNFVTNIFKIGSLKDFDLEIVKDANSSNTQEITLAGNFTVAFSSTHIVDFECEFILYRDMNEAYCWVQRVFQKIKSVSFDKGREIDLSSGGAPDKIRKMKECFGLV